MRYKVMMFVVLWIALFESAFAVWMFVEEQINGVAYVYEPNTVMRLFELSMAVILFLFAIFASWNIINKQIVPKMCSSLESANQTLNLKKELLNDRKEV